MSFVSFIFNLHLTAPFSYCQHIPRHIFTFLHCPHWSYFLSYPFYLYLHHLQLILPSFPPPLSLLILLSSFSLFLNIPSYPFPPSWLSPSLPPLPLLTQSILASPPTPDSVHPCLPCHSWLSPSLPPLPLLTQSLLASPPTPADVSSAALLAVTSCGVGPIGSFMGKYSGLRGLVYTLNRRYSHNSRSPVPRW